MTGDYFGPAKIEKDLEKTWLRLYDSEVISQILADYLDASYAAQVLGRGDYSELVANMRVRMIADYDLAKQVAETALEMDKAVLSTAGKLRQPCLLAHTKREALRDLLLRQ